MAKLPITIFTGFLGSGKTTLINRLLRDPATPKSVVIVNEFGEIGIDHDLIARSDDNVILLTNGCLCCAIRSSLVDTLRDLYLRRFQDKSIVFDRVIVETTGLAEPSPIIQAILGDPSINRHYDVDGIVTTVDAINGMATLKRHFEAAKQVSVADRIVVTKMDAIKGNEEVPGLWARLHYLNPGATILEATAELAVGALLRNLSSDGDENGIVDRWLAEDSSENFVRSWDDHQSGRGIHSYCIVRDKPLSHQAVELLLRAITDNLGERLLRVKGIINVAEAPDEPAVLDGAQQILHDLKWLDRWPSADRRTRIVFITEDIEKSVIEELLSVVDRVASRTIRAREYSGANELVAS